MPAASRVRAPRGAMTNPISSITLASPSSTHSAALARAPPPSASPRAATLCLPRAVPAALPLLGLSGEAITVAQAQAGGANASLTLLRVLEGALSRFEQSMQPAAHSPGS